VPPETKIKIKAFIGKIDNNDSYNSPVPGFTAIIHIDQKHEVNKLYGYGMV